MLKLLPAGGARGKTMRSLKSLGFILWTAWISANFHGNPFVHSIIVETFHKEIQRLLDDCTKEVKESLLIRTSCTSVLDFMANLTNFSIQ